MAGSNAGGPPPPKRVVKTFACANCGASISVRTPGEALAIVCGTCQSTIDATDENYRILRKYDETVDKYSPSLNLGSRAEIFGKKWEVIGFVVRQDEESAYRWREYLLFNPYYGYRWLTEASGHWNFVRTIKEIPERSASVGRNETAKFDNKKFKIYNRGKAKVIYAIGEFYWNIRVLDEVLMDDYICPPYMLSSEKDDKEINWSLSEYVDARVIIDAFKVRAGLVSIPTRAFANQPSKISESYRKVKPVWWLFLGLVTLIQVMTFVSAQNKLVYSNSYQFVPKVDKGKTITSPVFQLEKDKANVEISLSANVQNSWFYVAGELVNNDTGATFDFDRSLEYYWGVEDGESWTEGSPNSNVMLYSVPKGNYYLNLDCDSDPRINAGMPVNFSLLVKRDIPSVGDYFLCIFLLSILPVWGWTRTISFESERWRDSDFSPYSY
ncbi:MAG: DUF4178 domain-containing protein [Candidatus Obscuribacterales bacterium]|nr:DUF4178 domain-containing protein [Candidatus Obscuribacterales bacterium]